MASGRVMVQTCMFPIDTTHISSKARLHSINRSEIICALLGSQRKNSKFWLEIICRDCPNVKKSRKIIFRKICAQKFCPGSFATFFDLGGFANQNCSLWNTIKEGFIECVHLVLTSRKNFSFKEIFFFFRKNFS